MKLLCLSNGHGEDAIALRILRELQTHDQCPELAALPIVGEGRAYEGIPVIGPVQAMPSGGFIYMDGRQLVRDLWGGLLQLTWRQWQTIRDWAKTGDLILAVGDIVPLFFAWCSGAPFAFVGTAKSEYYLRDEAGRLPRRSWLQALESWSGSVYQPWERWLMQRPRCRAVFVRDRLTAEILQKFAIPAWDLGNPMMDDLARTLPVTGFGEGIGGKELAIALLPGSRPPEAYANWQQMMLAVRGIVDHFGGQRLLFLGAIAPGLSLDQLQTAVISQGWQVHTPTDHSNLAVFKQHKATLILSQQHFQEYLHRADFAIAMAGTATEQFVGLGKPAIAIPGTGPQFTARFAEAQSRLLGISVIVAPQPGQVATMIESLLNDPDRLQSIAENGHRRMGTPGAAQRIAAHLLSLMNHQ
ncbi:hypothetical protein DO97_15200 [Neosynechococcus sphagnicola sy1]|uniref:Lipid-A-disaccharide synthase n=1 Tax=Neosynechococcus sphagnicola sy1 TaxID=1497020 RepID=A0A098TSC0_9CYAN|nr:lipid-A-disaccharide synthase-related protein [Neosynechococcus sphagnicola]KGF73653.1 hypothetical protein DO97_15200 [Neosynechococcus sphagnicola sy1]